MFISNDLKMNDNQASRGTFQDTSFAIVGINIIKLEAGKHIYPIQFLSSLYWKEINTFSITLIS